MPKMHKKRTGATAKGNWRFRTKNKLRKIGVIPPRFEIRQQWTASRPAGRGRNKPNNSIESTNTLLRHCEETEGWKFPTGPL